MMVLKENLEVLAVHNIGSWLQNTMVLLGLILGCVCIAFALLAFIESWHMLYKVLLCVLTVFFIGCAFIGGASTTKHPYYSYEVVVPADYPIEELTNDYRIVSHEGNLYTIIDKNQPII